MLAVHGQQAKRTASSTEASTPAPESSLTWCLAQLSKAGNAVMDQTDGGGKLNRDTEKVKEAVRRARVGLWRALVAIRTRHIKGGSTGIARYRARGGLQPLLEVLRYPSCHRKTLDLALSILANCCTESETRVQVRKLGGICQVVEVLKNVPVETVQNRAARALGNLAIDPENSALIHSAGGVSPLILCLSPSSSSSSSPPTVPITSPCPKLECAQSAARALLYLSDTPSNRLSLLSQGALPALALLIGPEYPSGLRRASLRSLNELTRGCSAECAREVSRSGALAQLGLLASDDSDQPLREIALKTLANLCSQGCLRPLVGSLGVIQKFVEEVTKAPSKSGMFFRALCLCCKEAVNRVKVKESGGLEVLISFLSANQSHLLSRLAILAFVDFVYDESALEQLQGLGLVSLLVSRLVELAKGQETSVGEGDMPSSSSSSELMATSCFDSFDFPPLEGNKREEGGKEQGQGSSSFLSLRSWLLSEGLISCEGELLSPPGSGEGNWGSLCPSFSPPTPLSDRLSPFPCPSPTLTVPLHSSTPTSHTPATLSPPAPPVPTTPSTLVLPSSYHKRTAGSTPLFPVPSNPQPLSSSSLLFSVPPLHKHKLSPPSQPSSPPKKQSQVRSTTLSCTVPPDTPPGPPHLPVFNHPYHPEPWTTESPILLLLSRFSQSMDPSSALINSDVISGLLYYITQREDPSPRCFRILCRLSCNPNCLQGLVRTGSVALIRHRLCLREGVREGERQKDRVKASIRQLGKALLNNLRLQCESSFGSGVLTHIMLSGSDAERLNCTLSLPLINSNKLLLKKLLLDNGGLQSALERITWDDDNNDHSLGCWKSLSSWLYPPQPVTPSNLRSLYFSLLTECLSCLTGQPKLELDKQSVWLGTGIGVDMLLNNVTTALISETQSHFPPPLKKPCLAHSCPYLDSDFDIIFLLDDGSQVAANKDAVARENGSERGGSDYFQALLKGGFGEAQRNGGEGIPIRDVTTKMLLPVLHYLHGCCMSPGEREVGHKNSGMVGQTEGPKGNREQRKDGHCVVLASLMAGGLGKCRKSGEWDISLEEGEGFQNTPLAEAMAGASRFLVSGLQRELESSCVSLLRSLAASQPVSVSSVRRRSSEDTEKQPISKVPCEFETTGIESVGKSGLELVSARGTGKDLCSESDSDFEVPAERGNQAVECALQSGVQQGYSTKQRGQFQSRQGLVPGTEFDLGTRRKPNTNCVLNLESRAEHSVGSDFNTCDQLDSRLAWRSATRLDSELLSEPALETAQQSGLGRNRGSRLLKQERSISPTSSHSLLVFDKKEEGIANTVVGSETLVNSELLPQTPTLDRPTKLDSSDGIVPRTGSGSGSGTGSGTNSHVSPGTRSDKNPVVIKKNKLGSGFRSHSESASVSGIKFYSGCQGYLDPITDDQINSHSHLGTNQDSKPGVELHSSLRLISGLDRKIERLSQATSQSCCLSDRTGSKSVSAFQKDGASDLEACSMGELLFDSYDASPAPESDSMSSTMSGQISGLHSRQNFKSSCVSDLKSVKTSAPELGSCSELKIISDTELLSSSTPSLTPNSLSDMDYEEWSLVVSLPELYCFSQLHSYPRLGQMCLSVLLWQQRTSPWLTPSLAADCMSRLAQRSHCIETLKRDLLGLATQALS